MDRKWMLFLLLMAVATFGFSGTSFAFDKKKHKPLTLNVVKAYAVYAAAHGLRDLKRREIKALVAGSIKEDHANIFHPCETKRRLQNWHFYDPFLGTPHEIKPGYQKGIGMIHRTFHVRFHALVHTLSAQLNDDSTSLETYEILGRILHYIEDVGVPAHVAPIYHMKPEWGYGWLVRLKGEAIIPDGFDSFILPQRLQKKVIDDDLKKQLRGMQLNPDMKLEEVFPRRLKKLAEDTRNQVRNDVRWQDFWTLKGEKNWGDDSSEPGFVSYGKYGSKGFSVDSDEARCGEKYMSVDECNAFYLNRYRAVLLAGTELIAYIQTKF